MSKITIRVEGSIAPSIFCTSSVVCIRTEQTDSGSEFVYVYDGDKLIFAAPYMNVDIRLNQLTRKEESYGGL